jgi:hypothetical protein
VVTTLIALSLYSLPFCVDCEYPNPSGQVARKYRCFFWVICRAILGWLACTQKRLARANLRRTALLVITCLLAAGRIVLLMSLYYANVNSTLEARSRLAWRRGLKYSLGGEVSNIRLAVYNKPMSKEVTRNSGAMRRTLARRNSMAFPRELRDAIPPLHNGRVLELESINGDASNTVLFGPLVELKLIVKETGKLPRSFVVLMWLQPEAARELAATLTVLADLSGEREPGSSSGQ